MPITVRLNKVEEKEAIKKCLEINKLLISKEKRLIKESELVHFILENCIKNVQVDEKFNLTLFGA